MKKTRNRAPGLAVAVVCSTVLVAAPALAGSATRHRARDAATTAIRHPSNAHNHRVAVRDAAALLGQTPLPDGANSSLQEPAGDGGVLARPAFTEGVTKLVDQHAWWTVDLAPDQVFNYVQAHSPTGGKSDTTCSGGGSGPDWTCVGFAFRPRRGVLGVRELVVAIVGLGDGTTGVRADAQVQWIMDRPAGEKVPAGVGDIEIVKAAPGQPPSVSESVTDRAQVHRIIRLIDSLPILQPGSWHCPGEPSDAAMVTFNFNQAWDGPTRARATVPADATNGATGCDAMGFSVNGRARPPLVHGLHFLRAVGRLLGVKLSDLSR